MAVKLKKDNTMSASEAKNNFGELLEFARKNPVKIERNGRPVAVMLSAEEYERMEAMEDAWWAKQAEEASKEGFLGNKESESFLAEMLNVKD
jgi:antitoxin Phd